MIKNTASDEKLWTSRYLQLLLVNISTHLIHFILLVSMPLYIREMGGSNTQIGLATGIYSLSALLFRPLIGHLLDNYGRKPILVIGLIPWLAGVILLNFTSSVQLQLLIRLIQGIGFSVASTSCVTIATDLTPKSRLAEGIGYFGVTVTVTNAVGPLIGLFFIDHLSYKILFVAVIPLTILAMVLSLLIKTDVQKSDLGRKKFALKNLVSIEKGAVPASSMMVFASLSYGSIITFLAAFGFSRGIEDIQFFFIIFPCAVIFSRFFVGRISDRFSPLTVLIPAIFLSVISLVMIYSAHSVGVFAAAAVLYGIGYGSLLPILNALAVSSSPSEKRGAANATFYIALDLGIGGGSILLGYITNFFSFASIYLFAAGSVAFSLVLFLAINRSRGRIKKQ